MKIRTLKIVSIAPILFSMIGNIYAQNKKLPNILEKNDSATSFLTNQKISNHTDSGYKQYLESLFQENITQFVLKDSTNDSFQLPKLNIDTLGLRKPNVQKKSAINDFLQGGNITSENFYSTFQMPFQLNEPYYSRIYGDLELNVLGIPLNTSFFLTTEDQSFFNSNSLTLSFDFNRYFSDKKESVYQNINNQKKELSETKSIKQQLDLDIKKEMNLTDDFKKKIEKEKTVLHQEFVEEQSKLKENLLKTLKNQIFKKINDSLPLDSLNNSVSDSVLKDSNLAKLYNTYEFFDSLSRFDSSLWLKGISAEDISQYQDSISSLLKEKENEYSSKVEQLKLYDSIYKAQEEKVQLLIDKKSSLDSIIKNKSADIEKSFSKIRSLRNTDETDLKQKILQNTDQFDIGNFSAEFSPLSLRALPIRGINYKYAGDQIFCHTVVGKTFANFMNRYRSQRTNDIYQRKIQGTKIGIGKEKSNHFFINSVRMKDEESIDFAYPQFNWINGIGGQLTLFKTQIFAEIEHSNYDQNYLSETPLFLNNEDSSWAPLFIPAKEKFINSLAFYGKTTTPLSNKIKLQLEYQRAHLGFRSLASPFLRNDLEQFDAKINFKFFESKILLTSFYKYNRDNLSHEQPATNKLNGYGINVQTALKKYPNVQLGYTPFIQGNNHPDSLFRTNNQFKLFFANLSYNRQFAKVYSSTNLSFTESQMEYYLQNNLLASTRIFSINQNFNLQGGHRINLMYNRSISAPRIDSVAYKNAGIFHDFQWSKNYKMGYHINLMFFDNQGVNHRAGVNFTILKNHFIYSLNLQAGDMAMVWGIEDRSYVQALFSVQYSW